MPGYKKLTEEQEREVVMLYLSGMSQRKVAEKIGGISYTLVQATLRRNGVEARDRLDAMRETKRQGRVANDQLVREAADLYNSGLSWAAVGEVLDHSASHLCRLANDAGLVSKTRHRLPSPRRVAIIDDILEGGKCATQIMEAHGISRTHAHRMAKVAGVKLSPEPRKERDWGGYVYSGYKNGAKHKRGRVIPFDISRDDFDVLIQQDCHYCGAPPSNNWLSSGFMYNGLDRVDSDGPYALKNVVPCCGRCNVAKGTMSQDEFVAMAKSIASRH